MKVILKWKTNDYWRIGEHESWFSDMAKEGLHLRKVGSMFVHFVKEEPKETKYRIDVIHNKEITLEQQQMYLESGWSYVTRYGMFSVFSSPVELNALELHTDPVEQASTFKTLDKEVTRFAWLMAIIAVLFIGFIYYMVYPTPTLLFIEGEIISLFPIFIIIYLAYSLIHAAVAIRALRNKLKKGYAIDHAAPWKRMRNVHLFVSNVFVVLTIVTVSIPYIQLAMNDTVELPIHDIDEPIVRLSEIEQNTEMVRKESSIQGTIDIDNSYRYKWSIFAPVQYETHEQGVVYGQEWRDASGVYSPSIHSDVYKITFASMSEKLVRDLVERHSIFEESGKLVELEHTNFDLLIVREEDAEKKELFAAKGKGVMYVRYYGYAEMDRVIKSVADQISLIAN